MKYLKSRFMRRRLLSATLAGVIMTMTVLSNPQPVSSTTTSEDSQGAVNFQIVVSTVIPNGTNAESKNEEVIEEVRVQETLEEEIKAELAERARLKAIEEQKAYIASIVCDPTDVSRVSGLKESDFKLLTKGTWWEGNEEALVKLENECGINAMFAMAVSTLESGFGTSDRAQSRNNYYGLETSRYWDSLYNNTQYWGDLISTHYVGEGRSSVDSISTKYCPPNSDYWASFNKSEMTGLYNQLITRLNNTTL